MFFTPLPNCNYLVHSIFRYNDERKSLARKVASLLFSSLLLLAGTSQIAFNISNLIKLSFRKKNLKFAVLLTRYNHIFRFTTNLIRSEKHLRIRLFFTRVQIYFLERYKLINPFRVKRRFPYFSILLDNQKTYGFLIFSGGIERERCLHFLMSLKENICFIWVDQKRYIFHQIPIILLAEAFFFLMICYKKLFRQES